LGVVNRLRVPSEIILTEIGGAALA
jgi:hypothetical protein